MFTVFSLNCQLFGGGSHFIIRRFKLNSSKNLDKIFIVNMYYCVKLKTNREFIQTNFWTDYERC